MTGTVTITARTGPGLLATSKVITDVANLNLDLARGVVSITVAGEPQFSGPVQEYAITATTAVATTISGTVWAMTFT